jgi:site-specific DNA recombinase
VFDAVQEILRENAVTLRQTRQNTGALLTGLLFDDRGNRMSPTHANKHGVRYRYYVSQALLQGRNEEAGSVSRVPALDVEELILTSLRAHLGAENSDRLTSLNSIVERIVVQNGKLEIHFRERSLEADGQGALSCERPSCNLTGSIAVPWSRRKNTAARIDEPAVRDPLPRERREQIVKGVARARRWVDALVANQISDLSEIAQKEGMSERYVRAQLPLAFLAPNLIEGIANGTISSATSLSGLWSSLPLSWAEQELKFSCGIAVRTDQPTADMMQLRPA